MGFTQAVKNCFSKYVTFSGRAQRSEYWFFHLFWFLGVIATIVVDNILHINFAGLYGPFYLIFVFGNFLPAISVFVRRLHDTERSGWWYWFLLVPIVGVIMILIWFCKRGTPGDNRYGPDPLEPA